MLILYRLTRPERGADRDKNVARRDYLDTKVTSDWAAGDANFGVTA